MDGIAVGHVEELLDSLLDEDDRDEGGKVLLRKAGDVAHQVAGVRRHGNEQKKSNPQSDA